jgi:tetratricopeptide (TPR) repeat protein
MRAAVARYATASALAVLSLVAAPALAQEPVLSPAYVALLSRYAEGEREAAIADLAAWPEARLRGEMTNLAALRQRVRACLGCSAPSLWDSLPVRAGLMLHADAALAERRKGSLARLQESAALEYVQMMRDDPRHAAFVRRVLEATVAVHHLEMRWGPALDWADRALRIVPDSAPVLLAVAAIEEMEGTLVTPVPRWDAFADPLSDPAARHLRAQWEAGQETRDHFRKARDAARRALAADPASVEARLRLGRLAWRLREPDEARAELQAVVDAGSPTALVFLARLYLGGLAEDEGRLADAVPAYEAARAIVPSSQSAGLALSEVRHRLGDAAGARAALLAAVAEGGRRKASDPFWDYPFGASKDAAARLEALRRETAP